MIKKAVGFKNDRDEIQVTQAKVPTAIPETSEEDWASRQRFQSVLTMVRNGSIAMAILCVGIMVWFVIRRLTKVAPVAPAADTEPDKLQRITEALDRNPEMLAKVLSQWLERPKPADRAAA